MKITHDQAKERLQDVLNYNDRFDKENNDALLSEYIKQQEERDKSIDAINFETYSNLSEDYEELKSDIEKLLKMIGIKYHKEIWLNDAIVFEAIELMGKYNSAPSLIELVKKLLEVD